MVLNISGLSGGDEIFIISFSLPSEDSYTFYLHHHEFIIRPNSLTPPFAKHPHAKVPVRNMGLLSFIHSEKPFIIYHMSGTALSSRDSKIRNTNLYF